MRTIVVAFSDKNVMETVKGCKFGRTMEHYDISPHMLPSELFCLSKGVDYKVGSFRGLQGLHLLNHCSITFICT